MDSFTEYLETKLFPDAIICGCPYDVFWYHDPREFWCYVSAFKSKHKIEARQKDTFAWLQGAYIAKAICAVLPNGNPYPGQPCSFENEENKDTSALENGSSEGVIDTNRAMIESQLIHAGSILKEQTDKPKK